MYVLAVCFVVKMVDLNQLASTLLVEFPVIVLVFYKLWGFVVLKVAVTLSLDRLTA